ncbi:MAG: UDP-2,3-diacylglucosamine diphosphatase [Candidatus Zixiibacteriota bacterium]
MALYVFSDAHLGCGTPQDEARKIDKIKALVRLIKQDGERLIILGDLFDFWFEYKHVIPKAHHEVLFMLTELLNRGVRIDYVSGNHDFWMDDFFEKHMGIAVHQDRLQLEYDGRKWLLLHGDGLAPADGGYRFLKKILRNPLNIWLYRKLPPDWAFPLAKWVSGSSRDYTSQRDHQFAKDYESYARDQLENGFDVVVIGHLHIPIYRPYEPGVYINTGDFITHFSYLKCDHGTLSLENLA